MRTVNPRRALAPAAALALLVAACSDTDDAVEPAPEPAPATDSPPATETTLEPGPQGTVEASPTPTLTGPVEPVDVETVVTGLDAPWSITFLPDDEALVSQRDAATIVHVTADGEVSDVGEVPGVDGVEEGGLLGLALHPDEPDTLYVYATMGAENQVLRTTYDGAELGDFETIFDGIPAHPYHNGGRLAFGPDGMLYVSTGDAGDGARSQDRDQVAGKILRLTPDGGVPDDNPFDGSPVYSYGHRNVQGLAFDGDGRLWASEFGPDTMDELNLVEPGNNYGWPDVAGIAGDDRFTDPVEEWPVEEASPSGLAYVAGTLFMASLRGQRLWQIPVDGADTGDPQAFLDDHGRLRDAAVAPDGSLWVLTNNTDGRGDPRDGDDRILRVTLG